MSRDYRHGFNQVAKRGFKKARREEVAPRDVKGPSKQQREAFLRKAVRERDNDVFEDYDEVLR